MAASSELVADAILEDKLVDLWPDYPCLFDVRSQDFKNRDKRDSAYSEIGQKLGQTDEWVKQKLRSLRNSYTKAKKTPTSGSSRKVLTKRASWLLEKLQFLAPHIATRSSLSNLDEPSVIPTDGEGDDSLLLDEGVSEDQSEPPSPPTETQNHTSTKELLKRKQPINRKRQADEEYELIKGLALSIKQREINRQERENKSTSACNATETFGRYVTETLAEFDPGTRHLAMHKINDILFQAQMGTLVQDGQRAADPRFQAQQYFQAGWTTGNNTSNLNRPTMHVSTPHHQLPESAHMMSQLNHYSFPAQEPRSSSSTQEHQHWSGTSTCNSIPVHSQITTASDNSFSESTRLLSL